MDESFKSLSYDVLQKNSQAFLSLAESQLKPFKEQMGKFDSEIRELERRREGAYISLNKQISSLIETEKGLRVETANLVSALRSPNIRGSWGQLHLRRVVELAGMVAHCDFFEQKTLDFEGKSLRPDLIIHLPQERQIVIDAKTPLDAYLASIDTEDEELRHQKLKEHTIHLKSHIKNLSGKEYWRQFPRAPEYVILFLPSEAFFSSALQIDNGLIEMGALQNVILATPTTLIAILRAIALSWKQESLSKNAEEIAALGRDLYERLGVMADHFGRVGKALNQSVEAYNQTLASLESRVLVSARKLKESGIVPFHDELKVLEQVDKRTKDM